MENIKKYFLRYTAFSKSKEWVTVAIAKKGNWVVGGKGQRDTYCSLYTFVCTFWILNHVHTLPIQKNKIKAEMSITKKTKTKNFL